MRLVLSRTLAAVYLVTLIVFALWIRTLEWSQIEAGLAHGPACPLRRWTGLLCAFCGMTHSWIAAFRGEWGLAFSENGLGPPLLLLTTVWAALRLVRRHPWRWPRQTPLIALAVLGAYAVGRNLV